MSMQRYAVLLAAGASARMGENKLALSFRGKDALTLSVEAFLQLEEPPMEIIIAASQATSAAALALGGRYPMVRVVPGGESRGQSAAKALAAIGGEEGLVAIHDGARCLVAPDLIERTYRSAMEYGSGIAAIPVRDTLRRENGAPVARDGLFAMQTPQTFRLSLIRQAYRKAFAQGLTDTDDCGIYQAAGYEPRFVLGNLANQKLTYREDMAFFQAMEGNMTRMGYGEDTHALQPGRALILGGVDIPYEMGLLGHSDADALTHAVIDALLGAAALGDIGGHFPDTEERYRGVCSLVLLKRVAELLRKEGYVIGNVDATVIAQRPKLAPYIENMRKRLGDAMGVEPGRVSVKATTTEGMNDEGRGLCITARAVCTLTR